MGQGAGRLRALAALCLVLVTGSCASTSDPLPSSSGPLAEGPEWGGPGRGDQCFGGVGDPMSVHFGGSLISNTLDRPLTLTEVRVDDNVVGDVAMMDTVYGQWHEVGQERTHRGSAVEWPPHPSDGDGDEPPVQTLDLPVVIEPGTALNPLTGFRLDATDGPARIPYVLYVYEVGGRTYELVDPWGIRLETDEAGCDVSPATVPQDAEGEG